jgi:hypothetical protein
MNRTVTRTIARCLVSLGLLGALLAAGAAPSTGSNSTPIVDTLVELVGQ